MKHTREDVVRWLLLATIGMWLLVTVVLPVSELAARSLHRDVATVDATGQRAAREAFVGFENFRTYFSEPGRRASLLNTLWIAAASTLLSVGLAFGYAFSLTHTCAPGRRIFRLVAMLPLFAPTMLYGLSLVYLFGRQGLVTTGCFGRLPGLDIGLYGPVGIVLAETIFAFPAAFLILQVALSNMDARLYEAARSLGASRLRAFLTVTLPGSKFALLSAGFAAFVMAFTDFGAPKVVGGNFNVLAVDIYKQVVGQQNFGMGAAVSLILLAPAVLAFLADQWLRRRAPSLRFGARSVLYAPRPRRLVDAFAFVFCLAVAGAVLAAVLAGVYASLVEHWPYRLGLGLRHYDFSATGSRGAGPFVNSLQLAVWTAAAGTILTFVAAYLVEKTRGAGALRGVVHFLATLPLALPGLVIGIAYIFFFNRTALRLPGLQAPNPFAFLYGTMGLLVLSTVTHFFTVSYLTAAQALRQMDHEIETAAESLAVPFWVTLRRVTLPVCLPALIEVFGYLFVSGMSTVSAAIFLYTADTRPASVAVVNMDDAGDQAAAAALCTLILVANLAVRALTGTGTSALLRRTQRWRSR